jgi:RNA polymerase sigma-70 factor, ECF subfamily
MAAPTYGLALPRSARVHFCDEAIRLGQSLLRLFQALWDSKLIAEGLALIDKALRHRQPGPYQIQAAIAAVHARAMRPQDTDWTQIDALDAVLERLQPSPVVTLNRAVAVGKVRGPAAALAMIEPLGPRLSGYFQFFGVKGTLLLQLGRKNEVRIAFNQAIALASARAETHIRLHVDPLPLGQKTHEASEDVRDIGAPTERQILFAEHG